MSTAEWLTCVIFAGPMVALLLAACVRMDASLARPHSRPRRTLLPPVDREGFPVCMDPDGRFFKPALAATKTAPREQH